MKPSLATFCAVLLCASAAIAAPAAVGSLCDLHYPSDAEVEWECLELKEGDTPYGLFGKFWEDVLRFNRIDRLHFHAGQALKVPPQPEQVTEYTPMPTIFLAAREEAKIYPGSTSPKCSSEPTREESVFSGPVSLGMERHRVRTARSG